MTNAMTETQKYLYRAYNSQGAFLGQFYAASARAAYAQLRCNWQVSRGDSVTVSRADGQYADRVFVKRAK